MQMEHAIYGVVPLIKKVGMEEVAILTFPASSSATSPASSSPSQDDAEEEDRKDHEEEDGRQQRWEMSRATISSVSPLSERAPSSLHHEPTVDRTGMSAVCTIDYNGVLVAMDYLRAANPAASSSYHLVSHQDTPRSLVVLPDEMLVMTPRSVQEQMEWFLERHRYVEALQLVQDPSAEDVEIMTASMISQRAFDHYFGIKEYASAATFIPDLISGAANKNEAWTRLMQTFIDAHHVKVFSYPKLLGGTKLLKTQTM